ncbi:MAG: ChbG/HpnK family deacetylase [Chthoniobacteraceae bacterium]
MKLALRARGCASPAMRDFPAHRLILTGDDFGRSPAVNAAIEAWHRAGALNHAGLMVNEPHAEEAAAIARRNPELRVGLHLALCDGRASDGAAMGRSPAAAGMRLALFPGARARMRREIAAQFARFRALEFPATCWDGHMHLHLHPAVFAATLPVAREHGFRFMRLVREPGPPAFLPWIFSMLSRRAEPALRAAGIGFADAVFGLRKSGRMDPAEIDRALRHAPGGITEIYFHPGAERTLEDPAVVAALVRARADGSGPA